MSISTKKNHNSLLMFTLTLGVFGILNTEMGVVMTGNYVFPMPDDEIEFGDIK